LETRKEIHKHDDTVIRTSVTTLKWQVKLDLDLQQNVPVALIFINVTLISQEN